jgi:Tol biopolymer transport system component
VRGTPELVIGNRNRIHSFQWTPDSKELIFVEGPVGDGSLWRVAARGGTARQMLPGAGEVQSVSVPQRAWRLAYAAQDSDINVWRFDIGAKEARALLVGGFVDNEAHLSPDGKRIAFFSSRSGSEQMYLAEADGSDVRQVTNFEKPDGLHAVWTPDGRELVVSVRSAALGLRIFRMASAEPGRLIEMRKDAFATALSRDGRWYYYRSLASGQWEIWRDLYPDGGHAEQVTTIGGYMATESLDGRKLYFSKRHERDGVWEMELPKGTARRIVERPYRRSLFAPAKGGVYYVAEESGGWRQGLYFREDGRGTLKLLHLFERQLFWGLDLAPDGRSLLYSQYDVGNTHIMLVPDFR